MSHDDPSQTPPPRGRRPRAPRAAASPKPAIEASGGVEAGNASPPAYEAAETTATREASEIPKTTEAGAASSSPFTPPPSAAASVSLHDIPPASSRTDNASAPPPASSPVGGVREGDTGMGRKLKAPRAMTPTTLTRAQLEAEEALREEAERQRIDPFLEPVKLPSFLSSTSVVVLLLAISTVLGLFAYAQMVSTLASLWRLPVVLFWPGALILGLLASFLLWVVARMVLLYRRLQHNRQISVVRVRAVHRRASAQEKALGRVKQELTRYLTDFDVESERIADQLKAAGADDEALRRLRQARQRLLDPKPISSAAWLDNLEATFVSVLDRLAQDRVQHYAKWVALKTALSPNPLLDTFIVLYSNFMMVTDLCRLFQVRASRLGTMYLLLLIIFHAYISAGVGEQLGELGEDASDLLADTLGNLGATVTGMLAAKSAEATSQFFFTRRIGRRASAMLRPIAPAI